MKVNSKWKEESLQELETNDVKAFGKQYSSYIKQPKETFDQTHQHWVGYRVCY